MKKIVYNLSILLATSGLVLTSCSRDFTETQFFQSEVAIPITSVEQLNSFVNGMYVKMRSRHYLGKSLKAYAQIHTDETYCTLYSGRNVQFATYTMTSQSADAKDTWYGIYQVVANANIIINASDNLTYRGSALDASGKNELKYLKGQAYAVRAQAFFDLLRLYGQEYSSGNLGIVLPLEYNPSAKMPRASVDETRAQIESDFAKALDYIGDSGALSDKTYINKYAVKALMSRYYLYKKDYNKALKYADDVINSKAYSVAKASDLKLSFSKENPENSIFELAVGINGANGTNSYDYIMNSNGYANIAVLPSLLNSYDNDDVRLSLITVDDGEYFLNGKFSSLQGSNNVKVIRYEEVLLNAAEAAFMTGNTAKALDYVNDIRVNRGLTASTSITLDGIKVERSKELLGEGFRYWDLLRWNSVIPFYTNTGARDTKFDKNIGDYLLAFPIPRDETNVTGSKIVANPGYDN